MYPGMRPNATLRPGAFAMTELRKITLHTDVHAGNGPFLLLVHGFLSGRSQWGPNLEALSRVCRPVVGAEAGHAVNIEAAEVFNRAAVDFIRRLESGHVW
jgi:pimeloyl-ACP methyl ester carboxylesterase